MVFQYTSHDSPMKIRSKRMVQWKSMLYWTFYRWLGDYSKLVSGLLLITYRYLERPRGNPRTWHSYFRMWCCVHYCGWAVLKTKTFYPGLSSTQTHRSNMACWILTLTLPGSVHLSTAVEVLSNLHMIHVLGITLRRADYVSEEVVAI